MVSMTTVEGPLHGLQKCKCSDFIDENQACASSNRCLLFIKDYDDKTSFTFIQGIPSPAPFFWQNKVGFKRTSVSKYKAVMHQSLIWYSTKKDNTKGLPFHIFIWIVKTKTIMFRSKWNYSEICILFIQSLTAWDHSFVSLLHHGQIETEERREKSLKKRVIKCAMKSNILPHLRHSKTISLL